MNKTPMDIAVDFVKKDFAQRLSDYLSLRGIDVQSEISNFVADEVGEPDFAVSYPDGSDVCANIDDEPDQFRNDVEADADALESAGFSEGEDDYHDVCEYDD